MGNRSRFVVVGGAATILAAVAATRRRRIREVTEGFAASVMPSRLSPTAVTEEVDDEAHAPGHRHLPPEDEAPPLHSRTATAQRAGHGHPHPGA